MFLSRNRDCSNLCSFYNISYVICAVVRKLELQVWIYVVVYIPFLKFFTDESQEIDKRIKIIAIMESILLFISELHPHSYPDWVIEICVGPIKRIWVVVMSLSH